MESLSRRFLVLLVLSVLFCTGCSKDTAASPEDFGIPIPKEAGVSLQLVNRKPAPAGQRLMEIWDVRMKGRHMSETLRFYRTELPRHGWRIRTNDAQNGLPLGVQLVASNDKHNGGLMIVAEEGTTDTTITLIYVARP